MVGRKAITLNRLANGLAAVIFTLPLMANTVTYTYVGNDFNSVISPYTTSDSVTGWFMLASPLAANMTLPPGGSNISPLSYSFSDGIQTFGSSSPPADITFEIATDGNGNITEWDVALGNSTGSAVVTKNDPGNPGIGVIDVGILVPMETQGQIQNDPGTWISPEPGSWMLAGAGLVAIAAVRRRFRRGTA
jgi:MYXO-CTERM domain-containing protein